MTKQIRLPLTVLLLLMFLSVVGLAQAQTPTQTGVTRGSIRGTVREDSNGDGKCSEGTPVAGIPVSFVSNDERTVVYLQSGTDGTFGLVAAGLGTWQVSAMPDAGYALTSTKSVPAFIDETATLALGIDFCVRKTSGATLLPQTGGAIAASSAGMLLATFSAGASLLVGGLAIEWRRRRLD